MGSAMLDLTNLDLMRSTDLTLPLQDPTRKNEDLGEISLTVTLLPIPQEDKDQVSVEIYHNKSIYHQRTSIIFKKQECSYLCKSIRISFRCMRLFSKGECLNEKVLLSFLSYDDEMCLQIILECSSF